MTREEKELPGNGTLTSLKHFIYLDRNRLQSYTSQMLDGITQLRQLNETIRESSTDTPVIESGTETTESFKEGESGGSIKIVHANQKSYQKRSKTKGFESGGKSITTESLESLSEEKVNHDNIYINLERDLIQANFLKEVDGQLLMNTHCHSLVKVRGLARFMDWNSFKKIVNGIGELLPYLDNETPKGFAPNKKELKSGLKILDMFSLGSLTMQAKVDNANILASLNEEYLSITLDQLRASYIMPGDVNVIIVGVVAGEQNFSSHFSGLAGYMDMREILKAFVGKIDKVIDPIAIYTEIEAS